MPSTISRNSHVLVIGSIHVDLITRVARLPAPGETIVGGTFHTAAGGKGANQAVAAARMGAAVTMIGRVGDDMFGALAREALKCAGVDVTHVRTDAETATGTAQIVLDAGGQNAIAVASGANERLTSDQVAAAAAAWRGVGLVVLQCEIPLQTNLHIVRHATANGTPVLLNAAPAQALPDELRQAIAWLVVNEVEAEQLFGRSVRSVADGIAAARALQRSDQRVVVTLGELGAVFCGTRDPLHEPAPRVEVVDTTAAGDALVGALAAALVRGESDESAVRQAVRAGSLACTKLGAIPSLPTSDELRSSSL
jgi:ribokinase